MIIYALLCPFQSAIPLLCIQNLEPRVIDLTQVEEMMVSEAIKESLSISRSEE